MFLSASVFVALSLELSKELKALLIIFQYRKWRRKVASISTLTLLITCLTFPIRSDCGFKVPLVAKNLRANMTEWGYKSIPHFEHLKLCGIIIIWSRDQHKSMTNTLPTTLIKSHNFHSFFSFIRMEKIGMKLWIFYGFVIPSHSHPAVFAMHGGLWHER